MADIKNKQASKESQITELTLEEDDFGEPKVLKGASAVGQLLLNLFQTPPGTVADAPSLSLYINQYTNSIVDSATLHEIQSQIQKGLSQYFPDFPFFNVQVETTTNKDGKTVLIIGVKTAENQYMYDATSNDDGTFTVEEVKVSQTEE